MNAPSDLSDLDRLQAFIDEGERRAAALDNRGPLRFTKDGKLDPEIVETYQRVGMYVFEGLIQPAELQELKADLLDVIDRLPARQDSLLDRNGRPAVAAGFDPPVVAFSKPLGDPLGGKNVLRGRHAVKMFEPEPAKDAPPEIPYALTGVLQFSDAALRVYGHPDLLRVAATINGEDFVPFNETLIIKKPGLGASFAWHQDGMTHWESPNWDPLIHGFNFMVQLFGSTGANGLWYVPGSHRKGKADLKSIISRTGNLLPDAVPLITKPGDVALSNRQIVHGSFPNMSGDVRITLNLGFHRRKSVDGACGIDGGRGQDDRSYDADIIAKRSEIIGLAIDARRKHFPDETPFAYRPQIESGAKFDWNDAARAAIRHYNQYDLII